MKLCKDCKYYKKRVVDHHGFCLHNKADIWGPDSETGQLTYPLSYDMRRSDKWCGQDAKWWEKRYSWWQIFKK